MIYNLRTHILQLNMCSKVNLLLKEMNNFKMLYNLYVIYFKVILFIIKLYSFKTYIQIYVIIN